MTIFSNVCLGTRLDTITFGSHLSTGKPNVYLDFPFFHILIEASSMSSSCQPPKVIDIWRHKQVTTTTSEASYPFCQDHWLWQTTLGSSYPSATVVDHGGCNLDGQHNSRQEQQVSLLFDHVSLGCGGLHALRSAYNAKQDLNYSLKTS